MLSVLRSFSAALPRRHSDAAVSRGEDYYNFENIKILWGRQDDYEILHNLGKGKYAEVFKGINILNYEEAVIKMLKNPQSPKVCREVKILKTLNGLNNTPKFYDIVQDYGSQTISLILEYCDNADHRDLYKRLTDFEVRYYVYELLKALEYSHSLGIMHRDVKPGNIMIDHPKRKLRLIDWGLADYYIPNKDYSVRVASRYFKGPELLVGHTSYDYSLDMWSVGATLAGILFKKDAFFHGEDNDQVLLKITQVLGSEEYFEYIKKYDINLTEKLEVLITSCNKKPWSKFITPENMHLVNDAALELLDALLVYDHSYRVLPKEAMAFKYFEPVREMWNFIENNREIRYNEPYKETADIIKLNRKNNT